MNNTQRLATIDTLLAGVPPFECIPGCSDCCGPIDLTRLELKRIVRETGIRPSDLSFDNVMKIGGDCPLLDKETNRCSCYSIRPAICRVFGSSQHSRMICPHGRAPANPLSTGETNALMVQVEKLGHGLVEPLSKVAEHFIRAFSPEHAIGSSAVDHHD